MISASTMPNLSSLPLGSKSLVYSSIIYVVPRNWDDLIFLHETAKNNHVSSSVIFYIKDTKEIFGI